MGREREHHAAELPLTTAETCALSILGKRRRIKSQRDSSSRHDTRSKILQGRADRLAPLAARLVELRQTVGDGELLVLRRRGHLHVVAHHACLARLPDAGHLTHFGHGPKRARRTGNRRECDREKQCRSVGEHQ